MLGTNGPHEPPLFRSMGVETPRGDRGPGKANFERNIRLPSNKGLGDNPLKMCVCLCKVPKESKVLMAVCRSVTEGGTLWERSKENNIVRRHPETERRVQGFSILAKKFLGKSVDLFMVIKNLY